MTGLDDDVEPYWLEDELVLHAAGEPEAWLSSTDPVPLEDAVEGGEIVDWGETAEELGER